MTDIMFLLLGILLGGVPAWIIAKMKFSQSASSDILESDIEEMQAQIKSLEATRNLLDKEKAAVAAQLSLIQADREQKASELSEERAKLMDAQNRLGKAEEWFKSQKEKFASLESSYNEKLAKQESDFADKENRLRREIEELHKRTTAEFANLANKILDENSKKFTELNRSNLDVVLNPLNEKIKDFGEKVEKIYKSESEERITLKTEIKHLIELNKQISEEANNLAVALKGDNKKQGNWGEYILEQILERSGLTKGREYDTQFTSTNDTGDVIKPDVIVYLPDNKHVIIDSKVSLLAYDSMVNADTEEEKLRFQKDHLASVKNHIKLLGEKNYHTAKDLNSPEFILLFIPIESSFSTAVQAAEDLFNFAWERKIVLVSPSTLFATLRTIASVWKQERQKNNVIQIAKIGGALHDKFVGFVEDMKDIEKNLQRTQESYSSAFKKLSSGNGNMINAANKMKELGAKANKSLDPNLIDQANDNLIES